MCHSAHTGSRSSGHQLDIWFEIRKSPTVIGTLLRGTWGRRLLKQHSIRVTGRCISVSKKDPGHIPWQLQGMESIRFWRYQCSHLPRHWRNDIWIFPRHIDMGLETFEFSFGNVLWSTAWCTGSLATW